MKIQSIQSTNQVPLKQKSKKEVTFGFWMPCFDLGYVPKHERVIENKGLLSGKARIFLGQIADICQIKKRNVNIKGTRLKIKRTTFNELVTPAGTIKYKIDEMPTGTVITTKKRGNVIEKVVESKNGNWWHRIIESGKIIKLEIFNKKATKKLDTEKYIGKNI